MRCPALTDLPPPPAGKTGWPWTMGSPSLPDTTPGGAPWPRISIVTPSLNQGEFIEETIRSVLLQGYPNLEYIVIDGGSTDGSVEIIEKYGPRISYWANEPDRGQADAINKGLGRMTGELWSYLNSDDVLNKGALHLVGSHFSDHPGTNWVSGTTRVEGQGKTPWLLKPEPAPLDKVLAVWDRGEKFFFPASVSCFMSRHVPEAIGNFDISLHYSMDIGYYVRAQVHGFVQVVLDQELGLWRWHSESKTWRRGLAYGFRQDEVAIARRYVSRLPSARSRRRVRKGIRRQSRWVVVRRAMFSLSMGERVFLSIVKELVRDPVLLFFRPWWGALRRSVGS